jgi:hypothetical protein
MSRRDEIIKDIEEGISLKDRNLCIEMRARGFDAALEEVRKRMEEMHHFEGGLRIQTVLSFLDELQGGKDEE